MDYLTSYLPFPKEEQREPMEFKIPIQTIDKCYDASENVINDMELSQGSNAMYHKIFNMENSYEKLNTDALSKYFTDDETFLKDNQTFISECVPSNINYKTITDIVDIRKDIADETGFIEKYDYIEWENLKFLNNNSAFMKYLSLYQIASPVITFSFTNIYADNAFLYH